MPSSGEAFWSAVTAARNPKVLKTEGGTWHYVDVSNIPGVERLPHALVVLLENCVRRSATDEDAVRFARQIVDAGLCGRQGGEIEFMPARSSKTSRASPSLWTSPRCGTPWSHEGETPPR